MSLNSKNSIPNFEYPRISGRSIIGNEFPEFPATAEGIYLYRHFRIRPVIADLVATLAGLGPDRRAAR